MDDFRKILFGVVLGFIGVILLWVSFNTWASCGYALNNCNGSIPPVLRTSIPSLVPATLPAPARFLVPTATATTVIKATAAATETTAATSGGEQAASSTSTAPTQTVPSPAATSAPTAAASAAGSSSGGVHPSNPGGPGDAVNLKGDAATGAGVFANNCAVCHSPNGTGGNPNPGSTRGSIPALNPIDPTIKNSDYKTFATNLDLFIQHGSTPDGPGPTFSMPPWGDSGKLTQQQIADAIAYIISLNP